MQILLKTKITTFDSSDAATIRWSLKVTMTELG